MGEKVIVNQHEKVAEVILNNPAKMNCMGFQMLFELEDAVARVSEDESVSLIVFKGAGDKAFSTGADLKEFQTLPEGKVREWIETGHRVFNTIENLKKPTIAFINGYAMGGGMELALSCDFRIGTKTTIFSSPELHHGWLPGWGGITRLQRLVGEASAKQIVMLGERIDAREALRIGLLNKIDTPENKALEQTVNLLKGINPIAMELAKGILSDHVRSSNGKDILFDVMAVKMTGQ